VSDGSRGTSSRRSSNEIFSYLRERSFLGGPVLVVGIDLEELRVYLFDGSVEDDGGLAG
jgi:hypothetical protein